MRCCPFLQLSLVGVLCAGCSARPIQPASAELPADEALVGNSPSEHPTTVKAETSSAAAPQPNRLFFARDDFDGVVERAKQSGKLVFVDAWAEWCHTCLSMDAVVFGDPSLSGFASQYEFVAVDTERPQNEGFVSRFQMDTWPTFFVIRPSDLTLIGFWPGAGSVREMRDFLEQSLDAASALEGGSLPPHLAHFLAGRRAQSQAEDAVAAREFGRAYDSMPPEWPRKSELHLGYIDALAKTRNFKRCAEVGKRHLDEVSGAAKPVQFAQRYFTCLSQTSGPDREAEVQRALNKMRALAETPNADMAFDDRVDALTMLATAYGVMGQKKEAAAVVAKRLALAEEAALATKDPMEARAFDRVRVLAYLDLGQPERAVELLEQSERAHPHGYATPALFSEVWFRLGRPEDGLAALDRAVTNSEGPRRCDYLKDKVTRLGSLGGRSQETIETLERLIEERGKLRGAAHRQKLEQEKALLARYRKTSPK
jgi:thiol-disulfide isomerase/thioredoxin